MQKTAYELRISDWSSDVCSSDLQHQTGLQLPYEILLVDAAAVLPGIAAQADVVADGARINAGEQVPAEVLGGDEEVGARQARPHPRRAVVGRQIQIGRASCRERVGQYESFSVGAVSYKNNKTKIYAPHRQY